MNQDLSIFQLVLHASFVVQLVMVGLLAVSLVSWSMIFAKVFGLKRVHELNDGGLTVIVITHDHDVASRAGRRFAIVDGLVTETQPTPA